MVISIPKTNLRLLFVVSIPAGLRGRRLTANGADYFNLHDKNEKTVMKDKEKKSCCSRLLSVLDWAWHY